MLDLPTTPRDSAALLWLARRCRYWINHLKRRRKRLPQGPLSEEEVLLLSALVRTEREAEGLRQLLQDQYEKLYPQ